MKKFLGVKIISAEPQVKMGIPADKETIEQLGSEEVAIDGYKVVYADGYTSWSPADVFEEAYMPIDGLTFGLAIEAMKMGKCVARKGWNGKGMFIYKALPNIVPAEIVPKMVSLSDDTKKLIKTAISFGAGMTIVKPDGTADSWVASSSDTFAEDWFIVD